MGGKPRSEGWDRLLAGMGALARGDVSALPDLSEAEWIAFLAECDLHWTSPLAYRVLSAHRDRIAAPPEAWRGFRTSYLLSRARTRRADAVLIPVLAALEAAGVPVVVLKGLHLSVEVYDDPAMRPMIDADLLLRRDDLQRAARIVESFGFRQRPEGRRGRTDPHLPEAHRHHLGTFWYPDGPPIELHYDLSAPGSGRRFALDELWSRARPARVGAARVLVLAPEDALLHACHHAAVGHGFGVKLLNLCDVPVALGHWGADFDWDAFWSRARRWGVERSALLTLALVRDRLGYPLPDRAALPLLARRAELDALIGPAEQRMRRKAAALAWRMETRSRVEVGGASTVAVRAAVASQPSFRHRVKFVTSRIFISRGELAAWFGMRSPPSWVVLLHPVRIAAVSGRQVAGLARRATGRGVEPEARLLNWLSEG